MHTSSSNVSRNRPFMITTRDYIALAKENKIRGFELNYKVEGYVRNSIIMY